MWKSALLSKDIDLMTNEGRQTPTVDAEAYIWTMSTTQCSQSWTGPIACDLARWRVLVRDCHLMILGHANAIVMYAAVASDLASLSFTVTTAVKHCLWPYN